MEMKRDVRKPLKSILRARTAPENDPERQAIRIRFNLTPEQATIADLRPYRSTFPAMKRRRFLRMMESVVNEEEEEGQHDGGGGQVNVVSMANMVDEDDDEAMTMMSMEDDVGDNEVFEEEEVTIRLNTKRSFEEVDDEDGYGENEWFPRPTGSIERMEEEFHAVDNQNEEEMDEDEDDNQGTSSSSSPNTVNEIGVLVNDPWVENFMNRWQNVITLEIKVEGWGLRCEE